MRVLFTVGRTGQPFCTEVRNVIYKSENILRFTLPGDDFVELSDIDHDTAVRMIHTVYKDGLLDASKSYAFLNEDAYSVNDLPEYDTEVRKAKGVHPIHLT